MVITVDSKRMVILASLGVGLIMFIMYHQSAHQCPVPRTSTQNRCTQCPAVPPPLPCSECHQVRLSERPLRYICFPLCIFFTASCVFVALYSSKQCLELFYFATVPLNTGSLVFAMAASYDWHTMGDLLCSSTLVPAWPMALIIWSKLSKCHQCTSTLT